METDAHKPDRQLFVMFPDDTEDLLSMFEYEHFDSREFNFFILFYLTERRAEVSHGHAMDSSCIEVRKIRNGVYGKQHSRNYLNE